ncbi:MAG: hypothetical protein CL932_19415 [Deltaproteobacteria bacterium]|nr:hypothetical protein [Deltaproteobacteria bacterium]
MIMYHFHTVPYHYYTILDIRLEGRKNKQNTDLTPHQSQTSITTECCDHKPSITTPPCSQAYHAILLTFCKKKQPTPSPLLPRVKAHKVPT